MQDETHNLDVKGDVLLTLRNPNAPFAVWGGDRGDSDAFPTSTSQHIGPKQKKKAKKKKGKRASLDELHVTTELPSDPPLHSDAPSIESQPAATDEPLPIVDDAPTATDLPVEYYPTTEDDPTGPSKIMLRLSSAHLRLASPYFMKALSGTWKEASIGPDGLRHLHAEDWDKEALLILMRIIHGRNRPVPRVMDLERLAKIAVLVDYYKCYEVVEPFAEIWRQAVEVSLPVDVGRELVLYLFTSWVFRWQNIFEIVTKTAMEGCKEPLPRLGIPIPLPLIEVIDRERREHINEIIIVLRDLLGHFRDGCAPCSFECSSILLGALTKELYARGLEPPPEPSYSGHSYASTMHAVSSIRSPKWRPTWSGSFGNREPHACDLASIIQSKIGGLGPLKGLRLCDLLDHAPVYML